MSLAGGRVGHVGIEKVAIVRHLVSEGILHDRQVAREPGGCGDRGAGCKERGPDGRAADRAMGGGWGVNAKPVKSPARGRREDLSRFSGHGNRPGLHEGSAPGARRWVSGAGGIGRPASGQRQDQRRTNNYEWKATVSRHQHLPSETPAPPRRLAQGSNALREDVGSGVVGAKPRSRCLRRHAHDRRASRTRHTQLAASPLHPDRFSNAASVTLVVACRCGPRPSDHA